VIITVKIKSQTGQLQWQLWQQNNRLLSGCMLHARCLGMMAPKKGRSD
jgi:hypothetical protein